MFVDVGAFAVGGDGSGIRTDIGHVYFPQYDGRVAGQWVFMGDPLSTAINTNGIPGAYSRSMPSILSARTVAVVLDPTPSFS